MLPPFVEKAVVVLQQHAGSEREKRLVAFITTKPDQHYHEDILRELAFHHLPTLMVPERYVHLSELPLNANGKTDRKALESFKTNDT